MSTGQVWTLKSSMAAAACFAAIRSLRRTERIGTTRAVAETLLLLIGLAVTPIFIIVIVARYF